jgi:hypothetical protein
MDWPPCFHKTTTSAIAEHVEEGRPQELFGEPDGLLALALNGVGLVQNPCDPLRL